MCNRALLIKPLNISAPLFQVSSTENMIHKPNCTPMDWQILSGPFRETVQLWQAWKCTGKEKGEKVQLALQSLCTVAMIAFQVDHNGKSGLKSKGTAMHANCYLETTHCNRDAFVFSPIKDLCCHALRFHALGQLIQLWGVFGCLLPIWIWRWFGCYRCFLLQFLNISLRYTSHVL